MRLQRTLGHGERHNNNNNNNNNIASNALRQTVACNRPVKYLAYNCEDGRELVERPNFLNKMNPVNDSSPSTNALAQRQQQQQQSVSTRPIQIETFSSFPVNQIQTFDILLANHLKEAELIVNISNPIIGSLDKQIETIPAAQSTVANRGAKQPNKCRVSFRAPLVGVYTINVEMANQAQYKAQFQAKAYDLSKVFINGSSGKCFVNESYEFSVDASEAGEGQLEIAVNEGEIPNQVQVLDNGKCIVNFVPEDSVPHIVDIKFNGHNVNGCPFVVDVKRQNDDETDTQQVPTILGKPSLFKEERVLVNSTAMFSIENFRLESSYGSNEILITDPENQPVHYKFSEDVERAKFRFEFSPKVVGDYTVELKPKSELLNKLPTDILDQFPFPLKVFDFTKVIVSDVTDGVVGHPIYFFIDASQAGSGNLEIRVSSTTRNVPNHPQSEANAKIRVNFTPTEAVEHSIDVKFNGIPVPGNPFIVKVAQYPQARLPVSSQEALKYVAIDELISFYVDYIGCKENRNLPPEELTDKCCQVYVSRPDFVYTKLNTVELKQADKNDKQMKFQVSFKPTKIGPYKLFIIVNGELLPASPIVSNVYNIDEVKVYFESTKSNGEPSTTSQPKGQVNKPVTFTVDASRAGEGTLALAVVSGLSRTPVQTDVKVSEKGHGLYNLTFVPTEFSPHSIDMSFNDRVVPSSPFIVDILDANGRSYSDQVQQQTRPNNGVQSESVELEIKDNTHQMVQNFETLSLNKLSQTNKSSSKPSKSSTTNNTSKKSLAFGLVNSSNIVYLESGVLENSKSQVSLIGPNNEKVPFIKAKGSPQPGESKKTYIEYKPTSIGTHTINVLEGGKDLRQYFVEICDPCLIRITDLNSETEFTVGKPVVFGLDSSQSGDIQIDSITILGPPKRPVNGKSREADQTILGRIKSISSPSSQSHLLQSATPLEYSLLRLDEHKHEVKFIPRTAGKHSIDIRCLGQAVGPSPFEIEVLARSSSTAPGNDNNHRYQQQQTDQQQHQLYASTSQSMGKSSKSGIGMSKEDELLQSIVVHGISLKCSPVNSTGAFIIETNRLAQARDFDVLITDPTNNLVDVQCYLQQDGNLLAEWTPRRVGDHKIEVLYKDRQVPNSPFITQAFDPSGVIIKDVKKKIFSVNERIEFKLDRKEAGPGELDVAITSPVGQDLPIEVRPLSGDNEVGELICFTPTIAGNYKMSITFGGFDVPKSPITFTARDSRDPIKVSGSGLRCAEVNRSAQFTVESSSEGELKLRIESGDREIVPKLEQRGNSYSVKYKPTEVGYATVSIYWNGAHLEGSPFSIPVNDLGKFLFLSGTNKSSNSNNQRIIDYEPKVAKEITVDTSKCGPGDLNAEAYCRANPGIKFSIPVNQYAQNRYRLVFLCPPKPEQLAKGVSIKDISLEATYLIRFYYNNLFVPEALASVVVSPLQTFTSSNLSQYSRESSMNHQRNSELSAENPGSVLVETNNNNAKPPLVLDNHKEPQRDGVDCPIVALRGHGLVDAKCGEEAEFTIDGSEAGPGKPEVRFNGTSEEITVRLDQIGERLYKATYVAQVAGVYCLNVLWDGKQVAGCPISVNVIGNCDPSKVICTGDGLKGGVLGEEIKTFIDTRRAGPGELTAICTGPQKVAFCELLDRGDGTFVLYIKPQEPGRQFLTIKYGGQHIPKSPFCIKVSGKPDPTKVRVYGPGVDHGVLSLYQSRFVCDTRGAGAGQLTVRIRGPKGAFRMETQRESQRDRTILCKYDPTEPGDYRIEIKWSGRHVPGSPFSVMIFDTQEELNRFLASGQPNTTKLAAPVLHHQVPYQPTLVDYGHYSNMVPPTQQQPPFRLR